MGGQTGRGLATRIWGRMIAGAEARGRAEAARHLAWLPDEELAARGLTRADLRRMAKGR